jgi:hypothetical protein
MGTLAMLALVVPLAAGAQEEQHVAPPQEEQPQGQAPHAQPAPEEPQQITHQRPGWERCRSIMRMQPYYAGGGPYLPVAGGSVPAPSAPLSGGGGSFHGASGGGSGSGYAFLVLAVIVVAALPFIIYAIDDDADPLTADRYYCPEFHFTTLGGAAFPSTGDPSGIFSLRMKTSYAFIGGDFEIAAATTQTPINTWSTHVLFRAPPKKHLDGALALGIRQQGGPGGYLFGADLGLPHEYVFFRDGYKHFGLELTPRVFINTHKVDVGVESNIVIPIVDFLEVRLGGQLYTHAGNIQAVAGGGLSAWF